MRKSDHRNAIRSHEHFDALCAAAGLEVARAPLLQRRLRRRWSRTCCCGSTSRRAGAARRTRRRTPTTAGAGHAATTAGASARRRRDASRSAVGARAHLAPEARRRALRRHPHRPLLRPAASGAAAARVKILYVASDQVVPGRTGGSVHVLEVARGLAARGHEVHAVVRAARGAPGARASATACDWHRVAWWPPHRCFRFRARRGGRGARCASARPHVVMERYYNFGGEGMLAPRPRAACRRCSR